MDYGSVVFSPSKTACHLHPCSFVLRFNENSNKNNIHITIKNEGDFLVGQTKEFLLQTQGNL